MTTPSYEIVFEKEFLTDFFFYLEEPEENDDDEDTKRDFWRFLRHGKENVYYKSDFESEDEFYEAYRSNPIIRKVFNGPGQRLHFNEGFFSSSLNMDERIQGGLPVKFFLLKEENPEQINLAQSYGFLALHPRGISPSWTIFSDVHQRKEFTITQQTEENDPNTIFDGWHRIAEFEHPIHSILLFDPYLFSEPIEKNLKPLLKNLLTRVTKNSQLEIFILTQKESLPYNENSLSATIKSFLRTEIALNNLMIRVIPFGKYDGRFQQANKGEKMIDRWLITNYFIIDAGHGFNIFTQENMIKRGSYMRFSFACSFSALPKVNHLKSIVRNFLIQEKISLPRLLEIESANS